ncbi:MHS family MFS transporter [Salmonella enterica subsp. enterica serovar Montevideo]|nr:MHS family MFS transporter [Salmonella enterica]EED4684044.1 MHS family MFS transporter [Salmonella enterica subsp. enterica serovar Montevideo]EEN8126617.1 MHS family MFS transporter [Salmonella enterica subsp. enterica serovar Montevideo]
MTQIKHERSTQDLVRAAVSGWLGTALEFMDFQLYSLGAALVFHEIFFPEQSAAMALILAMGTYGAGYIARIIGAFVFGKMGDRIGRKKVLFITITMMGICTTLIGVLPTYAQIGIFAPVLLVTLRIIQGLGAGAEISGAGSGLIQTFLAGYLVQTLLFNKSIPTDALMISSVIGFITIPLLGWLSDKYGRRLPYIILNISAIILAWPMLSIVVDKTYSPGVIMAALIVIHNFAVLGLFALENITMAEIFGSRNRFTRMAISKEAGGLVAVGFGPVLAGIFCNMTDSWLPILIMLVLYSCIGLISALLMPEVRDRDLSLPEDAAEATAAEKLRHSATQTS